MDLTNTDGNAPDSWDALDDPGPGDMSGDGSDLSNKLQSLNVNATPFVPNVNAQPFVPSFMKNQETKGKAFITCRNWSKTFWFVFQYSSLWCQHNLLRIELS